MLNNLKVGDVVVRCGKILKTFKLSKDMIFFKPYFTTNNNSGDLIYSFPIKNLTLTSVRKIISKKKLNNLFKYISDSSIKERIDPASDIKKRLEESDLEETMKTIKMLWLEKETGEGILPSGKLAIYKNALKQSAKEIAAVRGFSLEKAEAEILSALKAGSPISN